MLNNWWLATGGGGSIIPAGIIMPFLDDAPNIPAGWEQFVAGKELAVVGHTVAGTEGGISTVGVVTAVSTHNGPAYNQASATGPAGSGSAAWKHFNGHVHTATVHRQERKEHYVFIKAQQDHTEFPPKIGLLAHEDLSVHESTLEQKADDQNRLLHFTTKETSKTVNSSHSVSHCGKAPNHHHANVHTPRKNMVNGTGWGMNSTGAHIHGLSLAKVIADVKAFYMNIWSSQTVAMQTVPGIYALWEADTAPDGWVFCDGKNSTPNLNDSICIKLTNDTAKLGTIDGAGTLVVSVSFHGNGGHGHRASGTFPRHTSGCYHQTLKAHTHGAGKTVDYIPPHYTIKFIKFVG